MGLLSGAITARRYVVDGEAPEGWRSKYAEALLENAFREPGSAAFKGEVIGWVEAHNLLDTDFTDSSKWNYEPFLLFALRIDKKSLPAALFRAHLDKRVRAWCAEHQREKCPRQVKEELHDELEHEMLRRTLPSARVVEVCWNVHDGWVLFGSHSNGVNETFRKRFFATFGLELHPQDPLGLVADDMVAAALELTGVSDLRVEA